MSRTRTVFGNKTHASEKHMDQRRNHMENFKYIAE